MLVRFGTDGSIYASQLLTAVTSEALGGAVARIRPDGSRTIRGEGSLFLTGGIAVGRRGQVCVAN